MKSSILATTALLATICLATPALSPSRQLLTAKQRVISGAQQSETPLFTPKSKPAQVINTVQVDLFPAWPGWFPWKVAQKVTGNVPSIPVAEYPAWPGWFPWQV